MFDELRTFVTVVELKNFTRAAEYLNLSQPSVSTHIKNLEAYFNVKLINRSIKQKSIVITDNGLKLYSRAKEILTLLELTSLELKNSSDSLSGTLKIGSSLTIGEYILPDFISKFSQKYPEIEIEILVNNTSAICNHLKELTLDIGLIEGAATFTNCTLDYFYEDNMTIATSYNKFKNFSRIDLDNQTWLVREEGSGTREYFNTFIESNKIVPKKLIVLGSNYAIKEGVKNDLGITFISNLVTKDAVKNNEISTYSLGTSFPRNLSYITNKNISNSKSVNIFIEELFNYIATSQL